MNTASMRPAFHGSGTGANALGGDTVGRSAHHESSHRSRRRAGDVLHAIGVFASTAFSVVVLGDRGH